MQPLAERARPQSIHDLIGQSHLLSQGSLLHQAVTQQQLHSMILWGPPGSGKTSFAQILANASQGQFIALSAVLDGIAQVRTAINQAKQSNLLQQDIILFVDEVHRFNKAQQDAFLPHIENGDIIFIGATTENPAFELNRALLSRCKVHQLEMLSYAEMQQILARSITFLPPPFNTYHIDFSLIEKPLIESAGGDARHLLNSVELLIHQQQPNAPKQLKPDQEALKAVIGNKVHDFDNHGDGWYDMISAVHKSIRGSDPDAGLYWFVRMIEAGCDPLYIARRLLAIASEDVGNADPRALPLAVAAWQTYERLGNAEGVRAIAQAILYLACAPKSNAVDTALNKARKVVRETPNYPVPLHLRNATSSLTQSLGHGTTYRYSHDEPYAFSAGQTYLPPELQSLSFYKPTDRGLEIQIKAKIEWIRSENKKFRKEL